MASEINDIRQLGFLLNRKKKYNFYFNFQELNADENTFWLNKINKNYGACGCFLGRIFMLIATALVLAYFYFEFDILYVKTEVPMTFYIGAFLFIISTSLIGKFFGKKIAYDKLKKDVLFLKQKIKDVNCGNMS